MRRFIPSFFAFLLTIALVWPTAHTLPQNPDEAQYGWSSVYYAKRLTHLNFQEGDGSFTNPGWHPLSWWALSVTMGTRYLYAFALDLTSTAPPARPYNWETDTALTTDTALSPYALLVMRLTSVLAAALGLALLAYRFRWRGLSAVALFLAIPHVRIDLGYAALDGALILGLGLCALAYGRRWFAVACGVAASFKLTALGLWPLLMLPRASGGWRPSVSLGTAILFWSALSPPSWYLGGPFYLFVMLAYRHQENLRQTELMHDPTNTIPFPSIVTWAFVPTRELIPIELGVLVALTCSIAWLWRNRQSLKSLRVGARTSVN